MRPPGALYDLDGASTGPSPYPNIWTGSTSITASAPVDLSDPRSTDIPLKVILNRTQNIHDLHWLKWTILMDVWPPLRIPNCVHGMWKVAFAEPAGEVRDLPTRNPSGEPGGWDSIGKLPCFAEIPTPFNPQVHPDHDNENPEVTNPFEFVTSGPCSS